MLFEAGYALKRLSHDRMLLIFDLAFGSPEELPFDLRDYRLITYDSRRAASESANTLDTLAATLRDALHLIITTRGLPEDIVPPARISLEYTVREETATRHGYRLPVLVTNTGTDELRDWSVIVEFPKELLEPRLSFLNMRELANGMVAISQTESGHSGPFAPEETKETIGIDYYFDDHLFQQRARLFPVEVKASLFAGGKLVAREVTTVERLQRF